MKVLYIEPFDAGSHAAFTQAVSSSLDADVVCLTLPGRHWKWRMRGAAVWLAQAERARLTERHDVILASSFLDLAALVALVPSLCEVPTALYFHENQLAYPTTERSSRERDAHFGITQMISALVADRCLFNSEYNRNSFLDEGAALLERMPDAVPPDWMASIAAKSEVVPVPLTLPSLDSRAAVMEPDRRLGPVILWNHRWEHDKNPAAFFAALRELKGRGVPFRLAVCGQRFQQAPAAFEHARARFEDRIVHWGYVESRAAYWRLLQRAHIAVSTARHEFFGVAMLEATHAGAFPLVPDRLAYPEHFPEAYRYGSDDELADRLEELARAWVARKAELRGRRDELVARYDAPRVLDDLRASLAALLA